MNDDLLNMNDDFIEYEWWSIEYEWRLLNIYGQVIEFCYIPATIPVCLVTKTSRDYGCQSSWRRVNMKVRFLTVGTGGHSQPAFRSLRALHAARLFSRPLIRT